MLQPDQKKKLDSNIRAMLEGGATEQEVGQYAKDFTSKFGNTEPVKKKENSTSPSPEQKSPSTPQSGPSGGIKKIDSNFKMFPNGESNQTTSPNVSLPKINKNLQEAINKPENVAKRKEFVRSETEKIRTATKLTEQEKIDSENELLAKKEQKGFWNNLTAFGKQAINKASEIIFSMTDEQTTPKELILDKDPLSDKKKEAKSALIEQGVKNPTPIEVNNYADKLYLDEVNLEKKQQKINSYLEELPELTKSALKIDAEQRFTSLSKNKKELTNRISLNQNHLQGLLDDLDNPNISEDKKIEIKNEISKVGKYLETDFKNFSKTSDELGTAQDEFDAFKRNYNALENFGGRAALSVANAGVDLYSGANYIANSFGAGEEYKQESIQKAREILEEKKNSFRPDNKDLTLDNFFQYSLDLLAEQSGTLAQIGLGKGVGVTALGIEAAGNKYSEMYQSNKSGETNYTPQQMKLAPFVSGLSEAVFAELPTIKTLRSSANVWKSAMKDAATKELAEKAIKNTSESIARGIFNDTKKEVNTELINNIIQNAVKKDIQGDKSVRYFDNSIKTLKDTVLLTGMIGSTGALPHVVLSTVKTFSEKADAIKVNKNAKKIAVLLSQFNDENISETTKKVIKEQIDIASKESSDIVSKTIDKLGKMPLNQIEAVYNNSKRISELQTEANEIKNDAGLNDASKKTLLEGLKSEFDTLQNENTKIINNDTLKNEVPSDVVSQEQSVESSTAPVTTEAQSTNTEPTPVVSDKTEGNYLLDTDSSQETGSKPEVKLPLNENEEENNVAEKTGVKVENFRDLYNVNRKVFGQNRVKALASSVVMDRMIGTMAKRSNTTKEEIYKTLEFKKSSEEEIKKLSEKGKTLFQIVGKNAKLSKGIKDNLGTARAMEKSGSDAKQIRVATGWEKGADGKWGYEIDDSKTSLKQDIYDLERGPLKQLLNHNELFELYPDLANIEIIPNFNMDSSATAFVDNNRIMINPDNIKDNQELLTTVLHEVQHFIQEKEGFSKGGSEETIRQILEEKISNKSTLKRITDKLFGKKSSVSSKQTNPQELLSQDDYKLYESLVGEVQARNVETRQSMSPEERSNTLLAETEDISRESQIILFQDSKGAVQLGEDGKAVIHALTSPDVSTPLHELAHVYEHYLTDAERKHVLDASGNTEWNTDTSEFFARGFEKYLSTGVAPDAALQKIFDKFKEWLTDIYNGIKDSEIDVKLNPEMEKIFAQMLGIDAAINSSIKENGKFYSGRKNKIENFNNTKGEFIFFSKNKEIANWYGGDESNVTEVEFDTIDFLNLSSQDKKAEFVKNNFTEKDIHTLYKDIINRFRFENEKDNWIKNKLEELQSERFSGDGELQNTLLRKIKDKGFPGVILEDTFFGKKDNSYIVFDKSIINQDKKNTFKASENGKSYTATFENGILEFTDKKGNKPSAPTKRKLHEKWAEDFDFTKGETAMELGKINDVSTWEEDVAEHSENPVEVAETLFNAMVMDGTEGLDSKSVHIAETIGGKGVERSSFAHRVGKKRMKDISGSIAAQYFAVKGEGSGLDIIAQNAEIAMYGDWDPKNPRVTEDDVLDFIYDNPRGTESFLNSIKKDKISRLETAFEHLTGLPASKKYLEKAINQAIEKENKLKNGSSLDFMTEEDLLSLHEEIQQFENQNYGKQEIREADKGSEGINEVADIEAGQQESGIQNESRSGVGENEATGVKEEKSTLEKITNQDNIKDDLDWLDSLKLDPNNLNTTLPFLPQTWNAFIEAVKIAVKAGNTIQNAIEIAAEELQKQGFSFKEIKAVVENFTPKAEAKAIADKGNFTQKQGKSSVLSRLNNPANSEKTLKLIDKIGLNYAIRRQETVYADGVNFVNEVGVFEAYKAVRDGKITHGDSAMVIYSQILNNMPKEIDNIMDNLKENDDVDAIIESLNKFQETVLAEYGARATMAGQTASIMNYIYNQNQEVQYSLSNQVEAHKKINNGEISPETMAKFKEIDSKYKEALVKIKELEAERDAQVAQQNFNNIVEQIKRTAPKNVKPLSEQAKILRDKIKKLKIPPPQGLRSTVGADVVYNAAVDIIAESVYKTGQIADAIQEGVKYLKNSDWFKSLTNDQQTESINNLVNAFGDIGSDILVSEEGDVKVPISRVRNFIENGGTDINELVSQVKKEIQDENPDITDRQIRDAISGYGKTINKTKSQLNQDINKLKRLGKLESVLEDLQKGVNKVKTPVERAKLSEKEKSLLSQIKSLKNQLGITESERTSRAEGYVKKRIAELKEKIKNNDFSKREVKPIEESDELKKLRIEKNRLQEEYDYLNYAQEMNNRTLGEKLKHAVSDLWDAQRTTLATGELSFVGMQGSFYVVDSTFSRKTLKNLANNFKNTTVEDWKTKPLKTISKIIKSAKSAEALIEMFNKMGTKNNYDDFQAMIKEHPMYDVFLKSGLRILGEDVKTQVRDDNFLGNNVLNILKIPFRLIAKADKNTKRTTVQGYYEKLKTGNISDKNKKDVGEMFDAANPLSVFERGNNTFMNIARIDLFTRGVEALELQGKNPIDHIAEYKKLASSVNTVTGSGNLSKSLTLAIPVLNKTFFSARLWASALNLTPPVSFYYFFKLGNYDTVTMSNPSSWKNVGVSVAQKTFLRTSVKGLLAAHGAAALTVMAINSGLDDDDEMDDEEKEAKRAYIEYDPRSSNFLQVVSGDARMDYFGPVRGNVILFSKLASKQTKNKAGEIVQNGEGFFNRTNFEIASTFIANKANPFPGMFAKNWQGKEVDVEDIETEETEKRTVLDFGGEYVEDVTIKSQLQNNMIPIYYKGINDVFDEDPVLGSEFHLFMSFIGKQTNIYGGKTSIKKEGKHSYQFNTGKSE